MMTTVTRQKMAKMASIALAMLELSEHGPYIVDGFRFFAARWESRCPACGVWIEKGNSIVKAYHPKASHDDAIYIHSSCASREAPTWPGLLDEMRSWLSQPQSPYIIIKKFEGRGNSTCTVCARSTKYLADVRKLGDFPDNTRICQSCAGEE